MILHMDLAERGYDILLERGALSRAASYLNLDRRVLILTDEGVPAVYAETVAKASVKRYGHDRFVHKTADYTVIGFNTSVIKAQTEAEPAEYAWL
ncbi:MAG: hypothetical protein IIW78_04065, partial [Clostridia bacterium]|nr:hypothetical protein [Clostridia bacterium]